MLNNVSEISIILIVEINQSMSIADEILQGITLRYEKEDNILVRLVYQSTTKEIKMMIRSI
jgi:hypothetical protein